MISKIKKILLKIKRDNKSLHQIDVSEKFVKENFKFNINNNHLTDEGMERILSFGKKIYQKELDLNSNKNDLWNEITSRQAHGDLKNFCLNKDKMKFKDLILEAGKTHLTYGFSNYKSYKDLSSSSKNRNKEAVQLLDKAISLAEYLRLSKVYNPEQGDWHTNDIDYHKLFNLIFNFKNKKIKPFKSPNYIYGVNFDKNFYCLKDLKNIYTSIRIDEIINNNKIKIVNEIGAGLGYAAYYNTFFNKLQYNIYDLPSILVLQAYYLMLSLGENEVFLDGEEKKDKSQISLFPYWKIFEHKFDDNILWVNQDSLPEIDIKLSKKYVENISRSKESFMLSINQESKNYNTKGMIQYPLYEIISKENWKLIYRSRDFLRFGYIEELYSIN